MLGSFLLAGRWAIQVSNFDQRLLPRERMLRLECRDAD
jgi:hypothetical protein